MKHTANILFLLTAFVALMVACANPGSGPDGGAYDETPPTIVSISPSRGTTDITALQKVTFVFSENVKLDKANEKIVVSPPQIETPDIKVSGRRVTVELLDSLKKDMTYTIDFSDAIQDATEGNPLGQFTYYFSTGNRVDSMEVAGHVISAETLEPQSGLLVGLYPDSLDTDSLFRTTPFLRVARTNSEGFFSIKGVAPGKYRAYALKDLDGDYKWSRGEMLGLCKSLIEPSCYPDILHDTVWIDSVRIDSVRTVPYTHFTPDNLIITAFQEKAKVRALQKIVRERPTFFTAYFTAPSAHTPTVGVIGRNTDFAFLTDANATNDTITYWIKDTELAENDSLSILLTYEATDDSTFVNSMRTDTLDLIPRITNARLAKEKAEAEARWQKQLDKRHKKGDYSKEVQPVEQAKLTLQVSSTITPMQNVFLKTEEPITHLDTAGVHLMLKVDSTFAPAPFRLVDNGLQSICLQAEWRPGQHYEVIADSAAIMTFSGKETRAIKKSFSILTADAVGSLFVQLKNADSTAVVQLLINEKKMAAQEKSHNGQVDFFYLKPGEYYLRLFYDRNGNGKWDTGDFLNGLEPEEVFYCPEVIQVRANWDTEYTWDVQAKDLLHQKPAQLVKNKAAQKKQSAHEKNLERKKNK